MKHIYLWAAVGLTAVITFVSAQPPTARPDKVGGFTNPPAGPPPGPGGPLTRGGGFTRGQIVNVNPQTRSVTLRMGTGTAAKETQFRVGNDARFFGADRRPLADGQRFDGLRAGTNVFFRPGTGNLANSITDLRLFDPSAPALTGQVARGRIVSVDPAAGTITIRSGTGANAREQQFRVGADTRFLGPDLLALNDGLRFAGFRNGADVWFVPGTGELANTLGGLSLANPIVATTDEGSAAGATTGVVGLMPDSRYIRGVIVMANADSGALSLRVGAGSKEQEANLRVTSDTRFFGADRQPVTGGLSFRGFRAGADVWFLTSGGELTGSITELRLHEPLVAAQERPATGGTGTEAARRPDAGATTVASKFMVGRVVELDPEARTITVKTGQGSEAREQVLKVVLDTEFFGPDGQPLQDGLKSNVMRAGIDVWLRVGTGEVANTLREVRLHDPSRAPDQDKAKDKPDR